MAELSGRGVDRKLKKIYFDPQHPASFGGFRKLFEAVRDDGISLWQVKAWLSGQDAYTLHKVARKKFKRSKVHVTTKDEQWQADLCDVGNLKKFNDGNKFLLTVIDCFSKYAWAVPLKDKTGESVRAAFDEIFQQSKRKPLNLQTDKGKEFINSVFQSFLQCNKINFFTTNNADIKACIAERFNRTLKSKMWRYFTQNNTRRYVDVLQQLLDSYNSTSHSTIKMSPVDVNDSNLLEVYHNIYGHNHPSISSKMAGRYKYMVGDHVRISKQKAVFEKGYVGNWTEEVFVITQIINRWPQCVYRLKDLADESIDGTFYQSELQKVEFDPKAEFKIEKVLRTKRERGGRIKYFVKWKGYPSKFNSWVSSAHKLPSTSSS